MDSTSSALSFALRDGQQGAEEDAALSVAAGLAKEAALLFHAGKFVDCLKILRQLLQQKEGDPKVVLVIACIVNSENWRRVRTGDSHMLGEFQVDPTDELVHHNLVIAENFQDGFSDPRKLIETLENIKKRNEELVPTNVEMGSSDGRKLMDDLKGAYSAGDQLSSSFPKYRNGIDTSVVMFNTAVIWFHLHEYARSFSYLDSLYQNIEPVDEGTALRICLLLLDVALICQNASRSADVLSYMEKVFCVNSLTTQGEHLTSAQQQSFSVPSSASMTNTPIPDSPYSDRSITSNTLENSLTRSLSEEELEEEPLQFSSLDVSEQTIQGRSAIASSNGFIRIQAEDSSSIVDLRLRLHLYKVRFFLLTRNLRAAKREVKMAMNLARGRDYPMALYLKSQLEFTRKNHRKAIKLLMASTNLTDIGICSMYYNDLGCIYYQLGKHHTSGVFFSKALKSSSLLRKGKTQKLLDTSEDKSLLILYNCGIHSLTCGRPYHAACCFQKASLIFYNRPLLWLRIAECCLMALEKGLIKCCATANRSNIEVSAIGKGKWRQLALRSGIALNGQSEYDGKNVLLPGDGKQPNLSMPLARQCLVNAMFLLEPPEAKYSRSGSKPSIGDSELRETMLSQGTDLSKAIGDDLKESSLESGSGQDNANGEVKEQKTGNNQTASLKNSVADYEHIRVKENQLIKQVILADLAYVELALDNPLKALLSAKSLLELPECSRMYIFLGNMYAAEASCRLDQPNEAAKYLMAYISGENNVELPYSREDCEKWTAEKVVDSDDSNDPRASSDAVRSREVSQATIFPSPEEARGIFCANYAVNIALQGDLERAQHFVLKALQDIPNSSQAILTAIYLDLRRGKTKEALTKLKQHSSIRFLPSNFILNGPSR